MSLNHGSKIVTSGLVLMLDAANIKSFRGEPTTNLLLYSEDFSNGWTGNMFGNWVDATVTTNISLNPYGILNADRLTNGYSRFQRVSASTNTTYTFSIWLKNVSLTINPQLHVVFGLNGAWVSMNNTLTVILSDITNWKRYSYTITSPSSGINQMEVGVDFSNSYNLGTSIDVWGAQLEQKSYSTNYIQSTTINGVRGTTVATGGGCEDLSGKGNHAELIGNTIYDILNNGSLKFGNGTFDYITIPSSSNFTFGTGDFTLDIWIYPQNFSTYTHMIALPDQNIFALKSEVTTGKIYFYTPTWNTYDDINWVLSLNTWHHVVFKRESGVGYCYLNSVFKGSKTGFTNNFTAQILNIHNGYGSGEMAECKISNAKVYNRALSATEILQNFNATKSRYGLT